MWRRRDGATEPLGLSVPNLLARLSPEGTRLALSAGGAAGKLSVLDLRRGVQAYLTPLGPDASFELQPAWTPDGRRISFSTEAGADRVFQVHWARADGSGPAELLRTTTMPTGPTGRPTDGRSSSPSATAVRGIQERVVGLFDRPPDPS